MVGAIIYLGQAQGLNGAVKGLALGRLAAFPIIIYGIYQETHLPTN